MRRLQRELHDFRFDDAKVLAERGLALGGTQEDRIRLTLLLGQISHDLSAMADARRYYESALALAEGASLLCQGLLGRASVKRVIDDVQGALNDVREVERLAARRTDSGVHVDLARAAYLRGNLLFVSGDWEACESAHRTGLDHARRAVRPDLEAAALGGLGDARYLAGRMAQAVDALTHCVEVSRARGFGKIEVANLAQLGCALTLVGPLTRAEAVLRQAEDIALRVGLKRSAITARVGLLFALYFQGRLDEVESAAVDLRAWIRELGALRFEQSVLFNVGRGLCLRGATSEGLQQLRRAAQIAEKTGLTFHGAEIYASLASFTPDRREARILHEMVASNPAVRMRRSCPLQRVHTSLRGGAPMGRPPAGAPASR